MRDKVFHGLALLGAGVTFTALALETLAPETISSLGASIIAIAALGWFAPVLATTAETSRFNFGVARFPVETAVTLLLAGIIYGWITKRIDHLQIAMLGAALSGVGMGAGLGSIRDAIDGPGPRSILKASKSREGAGFD